MFYVRDVLLFAVVLAVLGFVSWRVWRRAPALSGTESVVLTTGFVLAACSLLVWLSGWFIGVGTASVLCFLFPCALVLWWNRAAKRTSSGAFWKTFSLVEKLLALYLAAVFVLTFVLSLAPPVGNDYDSLMYHLAAPAQYLRHGKIVALPYDHHTFFPLATEMLFLLGLKLSGPVLAKLFHWLMLPLCCATILAVAERNGSRRAGMLGAALFASLPLVQVEAMTAYIDLALVAFTLLSVLCFLRWMEGDESRWLLACGVFCGACLGTKYFGVIPFAWLFIAAFFVMLKRRASQDKESPNASTSNAALAGRIGRGKSRSSFQSLGAFVVVALLFGGGWYARNAAWTGNPVFPFAYGVFGGRGWTQPLAEEYTRSVSAFGFGKSPIDLAWLPWRLSMTPLNVGVDAQKQPAGQPFWPLKPDAISSTRNTGLFEVNGLLANSFLGPALLAFGAPLLFARGKPRWIRFAGWSVLFFALVWALSSQTIRYALPLFALICWPCGWGIEMYARRSAFLKWTACGFFVVWLAWSPAVVAWQSRAAWPVVSGQQTPDDYLRRRAPGFVAMQEINGKTPPHARIAVYGEPRCFYLERDYFWADAANNTLIDYAAIHSARDWTNALQKLGATHVLVNLAPGENAGYGAVPTYLQEAKTQGLVREIFRTRFYSVLEITAK